ncbi:MAG: hypothetical protein WEE64_00600 [Dehalococcoidia bacterium]
MSPRGSRLVGLASVIATVALWVMTLALLSLTDDLSSGQARVDIVIALPTFLLLASVGALILARLPGHRIGLLFAFAPVSMMIANLAGVYYEAGRDHDLPARALIVALVTSTWLLGGGSLGAFLPLLFPTGEYLTPRWRWVGRLAAGCLIIAALAWTLTPGAVQGYEELTNPIGIPRTGLLMEVIGDAAFFGFVGATLMGIPSLVLRFRRAGSVERQQIKWFVGATLCALVLNLFVGPMLEFAGISLPGAVYLLAIGLVPASVGIAIFRYRLYDIDRIINRTLVYGLLTAALGLTYLGLVVGLQALFQPVAGGSDVAIALTTLAVAALFLPARRRIQDAVDSRFNRRRYDAARTLEAFSARLRDEVDMETLQGDLIAVVNETVQPAHVSLWLRPSEARR